MRTIEVEQISEVDAFSDDVKVGGLIEEIEAAEAAARKAQIRRQIRESQPGILTRAGRRISGLMQRKAKDFREGMRVLTARLPEEPKIARSKAARAEKAPKTRPVVKKAKRQIEWPTFTRAQVVRACVMAGLVTAAGELGIWAATHPYIYTVSEVPKTGQVVEADEDSPMTTEEKAETTQESTTEETTTSETTGTVKRTTYTRATSTSSAPTSSGITSVGGEPRSYGTSVDSRISDGETVDIIEEPEETPDEGGEDSGSSESSDGETEE